MSAHVLLNLLNELRKRDKMLGLPNHIESQCQINRGSYISAHVLLNLLNKFRKRDQM